MRSSLLAATVAALQEEIPGLGEVVAFDVKHIYACVKENNERAYVAERYDKTKILAGDPDCRLGVKRSTNQEQVDGSTKEKKELIWGYGSGMAAATTPDYGDVVLAEYTQPFNETDITYFRPLYERTVLALSSFPTHLAADAAFDANSLITPNTHSGSRGVLCGSDTKEPLAPRHRKTDREEIQMAPITFMPAHLGLLAPQAAPDREGVAPPANWSLSPGNMRQ